MFLRQASYRYFEVSLYVPYAQAGHQPPLYYHKCIHISDTFMKDKSIRIRLSEKRYLKLKAYAQVKEKTMTQVVEEWIDRLPTISTD